MSTTKGEYRRVIAKRCGRCHCGHYCEHGKALGYDGATKKTLCLRCYTRWLQDRFAANLEAMDRMMVEV